MFSKKDLWKRHAVQLVGRYPNVRIDLASEYFDTQVLDRHIQESREPFSKRDLEAHKIAVIGVNPEGTTLVFTCVPVSWAQYVTSTRVRNELPRSEQFHRLAACCNLETADKKTLLMLRSERAERYPNVWHVAAAGYVERIDVTEGTPHRAIAREIEEELNLSRTAITSIEILGVCEHQSNRIYEVCFHATVSITATEVLEGSVYAEDASEGELKSFSARRVKKMLHRELFNPAGAATLLMHFDL